MQKHYDNLFLAEEKKVGSSGKAAARFAAKLVDSLAAIVDDKELSSLVCEKSITFGMRDPEGFRAASAAMKKLIGLHPNDAEDFKARQIDLYRQIYAKARTGVEHSEAGAALLELTVSQANESGNAHRYAEAIKGYRDSAAIAIAIKSPQTDELNVRVKELQSKLQLADKAKVLSDRVAQQPDDANLRRQLMELYLFDLDDPAAASTVIGITLGANTQLALTLAAKKTDELSPDDLLVQARCYRDLAAHASPADKVLGLSRASACFGQWIEGHNKKDADRVKVVAESDAVIAQLAASGGMHVARILIWNTHNSTWMDRGATEINVALLLHGRTVWHRNGIAIEWKADKCMSIELRPTAAIANSVRVEIVKWHGNGGGIAEIQAFVGDKNLCLGGRALVSASYDSGFPASNVIDGNVDLPGYKGYWVLPDNRPGWAEVEFGAVTGPGRQARDTAHQ